MSATVFTDQIAVTTMLTMQNANDLKEARMADMMIEKPITLAKINKWTKFWLCFQLTLDASRKPHTTHFCI